MFALVSSMFSGLMSGLVGPLFTWLNKKQDTQLAGFQTAAGIDQAAYATFMQYQIAIGAQKAAANSWWGARVLYLIVGGHGGARTRRRCSSTAYPSRLSGACASLRLPRVCPTLPPVYADYERVIVYSLFVVSTLGPPASAVTAWLHRK